MDRLFLVGSGMITPVGVGLEMVNASVKAGINAYQQSNIVGLDDELLNMALVPTDAIKAAVDVRRLLGKNTTLTKRLLSLATVALDGMDALLTNQTVPLFLACSEDYQIFDQDIKSVLGKDFIQNLAIQSGVSIDVTNSRLISSGRAGALEVVDAAFEYMATGQNHIALVGGVDSFYDKTTMNYLDSSQRLLTASSSGGFVPGEGAGFMLLASPSAPEEITKLATAQIYCPGIAGEPGNILGDEPFRGEGLDSAFKAAITHSKSKINQIICSENGEAHYAKELSVALMRNQSALCKGYTVLRPAEFFGDMGAAFGVVAIGIASKNLSESFASLVCCSSDSGPRSAICLSMP